MTPEFSESAPGNILICCYSSKPEIFHEVGDRNHTMLMRRKN